MCFFNSSESNDNARFHVQRAGTKDLAIGFAKRCLIDCAKWEDGVHVTEEENSSLAHRFDFAHSGSVPREAREYMIAGFLVRDDLNLSAKPARFLSDNRAHTINGYFVVRR
jgi:hypothetical protein